MAENVDYYDWGVCIYVDVGYCVLLRATWVYVVVSVEV